MSKITQAISDLAVAVVAFIVMIILAIISFYFTVFVVVTGANLAGVTPGGNFVVLSAALLTASALLAGGMSPISYLSKPIMSDTGTTPTAQPTED